MGVQGGDLPLQSWVEFSSVETLDIFDLALHANAGRKRLITQTLPGPVFCAVLRCALQSEDYITQRQARWVGDTAAFLGCA